jgi:predicted transposase YbfD/YdcC
MHGGYDIYETLEADHGGIESRKFSIHPACKFLPEKNLASWRNLKTLIRLEAKREVQGKFTQEVRYYISDEQETKAAYFCSHIRGHRSIENQLHWHLDVTFKEDACRAGAGYASQNLSVLRKMDLHIVSEQKDRHCLRKRLYKAALDIGYLNKLLNI